MATGYLVGNSTFDSLYVRKEFFQQGAMWAWGSNAYGQLGDNTTTGKSSPIQNISGGLNWSIITGSSGSKAGLKTDGTLWTWGRNLSGSLGIGDNTNRSSPVQVGSTKIWKSVSGGGTGSATTFLAIRLDGTLWAWGNNSYGQVGDNTNVNKSSPVQNIAGGNNWAFVSAGRQSSAAIKTDGTLWVWGFNNPGLLGTNNLTNYSSPVQTVSGGTNWKYVSMGGSSSATLAIKTDGTLWPWGSNVHGQLGLGNTTNYSSPVQVGTNTNWKVVEAANEYSAGLKTDGTLWVWGRNNYGNLGTNNTTSYSSPVQTIAGGTNWKIISLGGISIKFMTAIKTDGTLWAWGGGGYGNLGNGATTNRSSPIQIGSGVNWKAISSGNNSVNAIRYI